jgi:hypothetical protein
MVAHACNPSTQEVEETTNIRRKAEFLLGLCYVLIKINEFALKKK